MNKFEEIYASHYARLYRVAVRMVNDRDGAADIVQETFTVLYEKMRTGEVLLYLNTWLYRVVLNKSIDFVRRRSRYSGLEDVSAWVAEASDEKTESRRLVREAMRALKPADQALLVLYSEGFSYKEIAEATGIRFASVGKTLARALEKMEKQLKKTGYEVH